MELSDVILGFLEWKQLTGYELKGLFSELDYLPWSGNNNQIYTALVELERAGLVEKQVVQQEKLPAQKRYSATEAGRARLRQAVLQQSEPLMTRSDFLVRLVWSQCLSTDEIVAMLDAYQAAVETELAMCRETIRRGGQSGARSDRERYLWDMAAAHRPAMLQAELNWLAQLRNGLANR